MKLGGWRRRDEELDEELRGHLRMAIRDRMEEHARHANVRYTQAIVNHALAQ